MRVKIQSSLSSQVEPIIQILFIGINRCLFEISYKTHDLLKFFCFYELHDDYFKINFRFTCSHKITHARFKRRFSRHRTKMLCHGFIFSSKIFEIYFSRREYFFVSEIDLAFPYRQVSIKRGEDVKKYYDLSEEIGR